LGCGVWGKTLVDKKLATYYSNRYSKNSSLSREQIYNLAFLAEKMLECESVDAAVETLIEYEERCMNEKRMSQSEIIELEGVNNLVEGKV
jgi:hypothetical protein